jgi:hypothetical protein
MIQKMQPIPRDAQIHAMLDGAIYTLLRQYIQDPERVDVRKFITIDRQNLIDFLSANPRKAEEYFQKHSQINGVHDVERISRDGDEYITSWMDHGHPNNIRRFKHLAEAVAEHVLVSHGLY